MGVFKNTVLSAFNQRPLDPEISQLH